MALLPYGSSMPIYHCGFVQWWRKAPDLHACGWQAICYTYFRAFTGIASYATLARSSPMIAFARGVRWAPWIPGT